MTGVFVTFIRVVYGCLCPDGVIEKADMTDLKIDLRFNEMIIT